MRFTFAEEEPPVRRRRWFASLRWLLDVLVIGAVVAAGLETLNILRGLFA